MLLIPARRFTSKGQLINVESTQEVTPPSKLDRVKMDQNEIFPEFQSLLSIPIAHTTSLVKNKTEANVLLQIRQLSTQLSILIRFLTNELQSGETIEDTWKKTQAGEAKELLHIIPLVEQEIQHHFHNIQYIMDKIAQCLSELAFQKRALMQYQEINASLSEELQYEGCTQLAKDKFKLSSLEKLLLKRLDSMFYQGPPYRSFASSWDDAAEQTCNESQNTTKESSTEKLSKQDAITEEVTNKDDTSDDELTNRTKELMKATQEKLFSFDSSWPLSSGSSSDSGRSNSTPTTPLRCKKRYVSKSQRHNLIWSSERAENIEDEGPEWKKIKALSTSPGGSQSDSSSFLYSPKPIRFSHP